MDKKLYCNLMLCQACRSCDLACAVQRGKSTDFLDELNDYAQKHKILIRPLEEFERLLIEANLPSFPCQECPEKPCLTTCPTHAISYSKNKQIMQIEQDLCTNCWECVKNCPSAAIVFDRQIEKALQCNLCPEFELKPCIWVCPSGALFFGDFGEYLRKLKESIEDEDFRDYCFQMEG